MTKIRSVISEYFFLCYVKIITLLLFFFLNDPAPPETSPLPLPAALPISAARRLRLPPAVGARQPAAPLRRVPREGAADGLRLRDAGAVRAPPLDPDRRAADPPDRDRRPGGRAARDEEPDRRPAERGAPAGGGRRASARDHADQKDGRGPDRLPARVGRQGALPPLRDRHARADPDHPRAPARRVRRARRRQPAARRARPPRGLPRRSARRRQGRLPARQDGARPDDRPRSAEHERQGADVRGQADRGDQGRTRRDEPPPHQAARLQRGARDHAGVDPEGRLRYRRVPLARVADRYGPAPPRRPQGRGHEYRGAREARDHARGGDVHGRGGAAVRVRGQAPRRDQGPAARGARSDAGHALGQMTLAFIIAILIWGFAIGGPAPRIRPPPRPPPVWGAAAPWARGGADLG